MADVPKPGYRVGDLLWSKETKNGRVWWPAMVTYDPNSAQYFRSPGKQSQYHVQFFGPEPTRGWVPKNNLQVFSSGSQFPLPEKGLSKKFRKDHSNAVSEIEQALKFDYKQRKLQFIFNFDSDKRAPSLPPPAKVVRKKRPRDPKDDVIPVRTVRKQPKIMDSMKSEGKPNTPIEDHKVSVKQPASKPVSKQLAQTMEGSVLHISQPPLPIQNSPCKSMVSVQQPVNSTVPLLPLIQMTSPPILPLTQPFLLPVSPTQQPALFPVDRYYSSLLPVTSIHYATNYMPGQALSLPPQALPAFSTLHSPPKVATLASSITATSVSGMLTRSRRRSPDPVPSKVIEYLPDPKALEAAIDTNSDVSAPSAILTPPCSGSEESADSEIVVDKAPSSAVVLSSGKKGVCSICDESGDNLLVCEGHCLSMFHLDCLGLVKTPQFKFLCDECLMDTGKCFICNESGELVKCSKAKCPKLYHLSCIGNNKLFVFEANKKRFSCPLHVCGRCTSIGVKYSPSAALIQCTKCPLALHKANCLVAGCEVISATHMICYQHLKVHTKQNLYRHINLNTCMECGLVGELYCCDVCSAGYHMDCLEGDSKPESEADTWKCPSCAVHDLATYGSMVLCKFGQWRWWPAEIKDPSEVPDNIENRSPGECMFVVRFCGTNDYTWMHHGRMVPYTGQIEDSKTKKTTAVFKKALLEAEQLYHSKKQEKELREAKNKKHNSKRYTKIKVNKYLVQKPALKESSMLCLPCQCTASQPCNDDSSCVNRASHIECDPHNCPVGTKCENQRMLKCQDAKTTPVYTGTRGWGLRVDQDLAAGDFVVEYIGEVLDTAMCKERLESYHKDDVVNYYMLTLDAGLVIDASQKSNHARFINHSCDPNCESQKWTVRDETRIGIFACTSIKAGTELTFDYHLDSLGNDKKRCLCGSQNCSGFMGLKSTKIVNAVEKPKPKKIVKRKRKRRPRKTPTTDSHEDDCFICGDGGDLLMCDVEKCPKSYHLNCLNLADLPPESVIWKCPRHSCKECLKDPIEFCTECPNSYCVEHSKGKFLSTKKNKICLECPSKSFPIKVKARCQTLETTNRSEVVQAKKEFYEPNNITVEQ